MRFTKGRFAFIVATHTDKAHIHNHILCAPIRGRVNPLSKRQGGIISPILANIYLDQFDKYMAEYKKRFDRGDKRAVNVEYRKLSDKRIRLKRKLAKAQSEEEKQSLTRCIIRVGFQGRS